MYLLRDAGEHQESPVDNDGNSLLVAACQYGALTDCVPLILERWPDSINLPESRYGQTPLSIACELGNETVLDLLLASENLELNKTTLKFGEQTPLHVAVKKGYLPIVQKLLDKKGIAVNAKHAGGKTALDEAYDNVEIAKALLVHEQTGSKARLNFLLRNIKKNEVDFQNLVPDILPLVEDSDITDGFLNKLVATSEELHSSVPFSAFVRRAIERGRNLERPYHKAARVGSPGLLKILNERGSDPNDLDEDGWSCIEYAETYLETTLDISIKDLIKITLPSQDKDTRIINPGPLDDLYLDSCFAVEACGKMNHQNCIGLHGESEKSQFNTD